MALGEAEAPLGEGFVNIAVRVGLLLSGLAILFFSIVLADFLVVGSEGASVYVIYYVLWLTVALAFIWLGVFVGHVVAKGIRVLR